MDEQYISEPCPLCNGSSAFLGILGNLIWWRCLGCGITHAVLGDPEAVLVRLDA